MLSLKPNGRIRGSGVGFSYLSVLTGFILLSLVLSPAINAKQPKQTEAEKQNKHCQDQAAKKQAEADKKQAEVNKEKSAKKQAEADKKQAEANKQREYCQQQSASELQPANSAPQQTKTSQPTGARVVLASPPASIAPPAPATAPRPPTPVRQPTVKRSISLTAHQWQQISRHITRVRLVRAVKGQDQFTLPAALPQSGPADPFSALISLASSVLWFFRKRLLKIRWPNFLPRRF